jgi:hypothetical protein
VEDTKVKPSSGPSTSVWQNPETSALTSQSEISPTPLSFLWCSFRVKRIASITLLEIFRELAKPESKPRKPGVKQPLEPVAHSISLSIF